MIAGRVTAGGILDLEWKLALLSVEKILERRARPRPSNKHFFVFDPADHVHVDHGDGFVERQRRLLYPLRGTEQAELFPRKIRKENAALELAFPRSQDTREFQNARGAGGVVVGAGMNFSDLRRRERIDVSVAEVIVVSADDDVLIGLSGKVGQHVVHDRARLLDIDTERNQKRAGKRK